MMALALAAIGGALAYRFHGPAHTRSAAETRVTSAILEPVGHPLPAGLVPMAVQPFAEPDSLALARRLVAGSPSQALAWAFAAADDSQRQRRLALALQAWGEVDPHPALQWLLTQAAAGREWEIKAVLAGAISHPPSALKAGWQLMAEDADAGGIYATLLAKTLGANGQFAEAFDFIQHLPAGTAPDPVNALFRRWAETEPSAAMLAVNDITDPPLHAAAFAAATAAWTSRDPAGLAAYANTMPPGADRAHTLGLAMDQWSLQNPAGLAEWLNTLQPGPEFDAGVALMIGRTDEANRPPETALQWVEGISDPGLRQNSLIQVLMQWNQTAPSAAQNYVATADWLSDGQRQAILARLGGG